MDRNALRNTKTQTKESAMAAVDMSKAFSGERSALNDDQAIVESDVAVDEVKSSSITDPALQLTVGASKLSWSNMAEVEFDGVETHHDQLGVNEKGKMIETLGGPIEGKENSIQIEEFGDLVVLKRDFINFLEIIVTQIRVYNCIILSLPLLILDQ